MVAAGAKKLQALFAAGRERQRVTAGVEKDDGHERAGVRVVLDDEDVQSTGTWIGGRAHEVSKSKQRTKARPRGNAHPLHQLRNEIATRSKTAPKFMAKSAIRIGTRSARDSAKRCIMTTTVSQTQTDMGTARSPSPRVREQAPLLVRLRDGIQSHPYRSLLVAAAVGAGVGLALSSRVTRAITFRAGTFAITEIIQKYLREAISGGVRSAA
jgi:ElaB/YqjD/DUF883 family membrane-anchored ribosome-binding protein